MLPIHKILHPTDYSDSSAPAFHLACALARDFGAELIVCHVAPPAIFVGGEGMVVEIPEQEIEEMTNRLKRVSPTDAGIRVSHHLLRGDCAGEIVRLADELKVDLIVMGTHGRSGIGRLLMGSVAEAVMRHAPCPVVTAKAPIPSAPEPKPEPALAGQHLSSWDA